jgi:hypothetical protein
MALIGVYSLQGRTRVNRSVQLSVYYNPETETNEDFCNDNGNTLVTIYTPIYTTLANIVSNTANIYTNASLTILAPSGHYGITNGGSGNTWYKWYDEGAGHVWGNSGTCAD